MSEEEVGLKIIGKPTPIISSRDKVTGRAKYTDDLRLDHPLIIKILRSPHSSAKILSIDTTQAIHTDGVKAVITGADFSKTFGVLPISRDEPALAKNRVRYIGEGVAAVAAESEEAALLALTKITINYEPTKPCLEKRDGLRKTTDPIHPELGKDTNLHKSVHQEFGDLAAGFAETGAAVVEGSFDFLPLSHGFTEPHATQVEINCDGELTVYSATQVPHYLHRALSEVLEIPMHKIRVIKPHLGGGFGGKSDPFTHEMIAAKLALLTGRNTRVTLSREEVFFTNHGRHSTELKMKLALHPEKGVSALSADILIDGGAYGSFGVVTTYYNGVLLHGPYPVPNFAFTCDRVYTNKPMSGAMRGHGGVNPRFASEVLFDMACDKLKIDPCETRLKFMHHENTLTVNQFRITSCGLKEGLREAMVKSRWKEKHKKLPYGKGIGVACGFFISGSALPIHWNEMPQSTVRLTLDFDGGITVYSGASDIGQGSDTMLAQIVAEVVGVPLSFIKVISADTRLCPIDLGSYSSRVTFMAGNAARNAASLLKQKLLETAAKMQSEKNGQLPDYLDIARRSLDHEGAIQTKGVYISPKLGGSFKGAGAGLSPSYSFTAFITEVSVDRATGFVKVDKVTCAHDCGRPLNPLAVEGQLEGSIHMGLGQALMEGVIYDDGAVQNASFLEYKIPSPFEQPEIEIILPDSGEKEGPFGAKEVGEGALAPLVPSIANAIFDAVGVRLMSVPMTPQNVLAAIEALK